MRFADVFTSGVVGFLIGYGSAVGSFELAVLAFVVAALAPLLARVVVRRWRRRSERWFRVVSIDDSGLTLEAVKGSTRFRADWVLSAYPVEPPEEDHKLMGMPSP